MRNNTQQYRYLTLISLPDTDNGIGASPPSMVLFSHDQNKNQSWNLRVALETATYTANKYINPSVRLYNKLKFSYHESNSHIYTNIQDSNKVPS